MQTTYNIEQANAVVGQQVDSYDVRGNWIFSAVAYGEAIPFGRLGAVQDGSNYIDGYKVKLPTVADCDEVTEGEETYLEYDGMGILTLRDLQKVTGQYENHDTIGAMIFGKMWVETEQEVTQEDCEGGEVWVRVAGVKEVHTITIDADLIADNVIAATVNGVVCEATYDGVSHDTTMQTFADAVAACPGIETATLDGADNYVLTITADTMGEHITITDESVTGGVSQPTITLAQATLGVSSDARGRFRKEDDTSNPGTFARVENIMWLAPHASGMAPVMCVMFGGNGDHDEGPEPQV